MTWNVLGGTVRTATIFSSGWVTTVRALSSPG
jgi:hypothetical protein